MSFSKQTANRIHQSARSIERAIIIAENIPADVRKRLVGTKMAGNQVHFLSLASQAPAIQRKAVTLALEGSAKNLKNSGYESRGHRRCLIQPPKNAGFVD